MTYGIRVKNNSGQLLISDETTTFYYYGPAEVTDATNSYDYGGVSVYIFRTYTDKPIIPFLRPRDSNLCAITRIYRGYANLWEIEVAVGGIDSYPPEVLIFTTAEAPYWNQRFSRGSMRYGIKVKRSDGSIAFDSSVGQPLAVNYAVDVIPPYDPNAGGTDLSPTNVNYYYVPGSQPMIGYYSMALCEREYSVSQYDRSCTGISYGGSCIGFQDVWARTDRYWAFYHSAVGLSGNLLKVGWVTYSSGHQWATQSGSSFDIFIPILDLGGGNAQGGAPPIVNTDVNLTYSKVIVVDKSIYPGTNYSYVPPPPNPPTNLQAQTSITTNGTQILSADWSKPADYPFAYKYKVYFKPVGTSTFNFVGETTTTQASGPAAYTTTPITIPNGTTTYQGQRWYSPAGNYWFQVDYNGNMSVWSTATGSWVYYFPFAAQAGYTGGFLQVQASGTIAYFSSIDNHAIWWINTNAGPTTFIQVNNSGDLWAVATNSSGQVTYQTLLYDQTGGEGGYAPPVTVSARYDVKVVSVNSIGTEGGYAQVVSTVGPDNTPPPYDPGGYY